MAKATLPTNYKDDILNSSMNGKRRYQEIPNSDGTISLEDKTVYTQTGTNFGASQVNEMNRNINESADAGRIIDSLSSIMTNTQQKYIAGALALKEVNNSLAGVKFKVDPVSGKITGYTTTIGGADSVFPFSGAIQIESLSSDPYIGNAAGTVFDKTYTIQHDGIFYVHAYNDQKFGVRPIIVKKNSIEVARDPGDGTLITGIEASTGDEFNLNFYYGNASAIVLLCHL